MDYLEIGNRKIGKLFKPLVIAEIGINHQGSMKRAFKLINAAKKSGASAVKKF